MQRADASQLAGHVGLGRGFSSTGLGGFFQHLGQVMSRVTARRSRDLLGGMASVAPLVRGHASSDLVDVLTAAGPGGLSAGLAGSR